MRSRAFTLIELLVVIAIIGLLSSVILASLNSARQKAQYAAVASELQEAQKAFYALSLDRGSFPLDSGNPSVSSLIADSSFGLSKYLAAAPSWPFGSSTWHYDNDGDAIPAGYCGPSGRYQASGVNLFVSGVTEDQYEAMDKVLDGDANPNTTAAKTCGKIVYDGSSTLVFNISPTQ